MTSVDYLVFNVYFPFNVTLLKPLLLLPFHLIQTTDLSNSKMDPSNQTMIKTTVGVLFKEPVTEEMYGYISFFLSIWW